MDRMDALLMKCVILMRDLQVKVIGRGDRL